jgi:gliding motility-associated-like protein
VKLLLLAFLITLSLQIHAQSCAGSLGDPVINQDFGSGLNPGGPLSTNITNMTYTQLNCPDDGSYTIANSMIGAGNCHPDTWHSLEHDHTGNPNGYMMIINASKTPSIFFTQTANGLCPNTTYEFSSYILNLIKKSAARPDVSEPNITFSIETTAGQVLALDTTGTIPPTDNVFWYKYGVYFTTPANVTDVVVKMTNNAPGGNGNDLVLDDITFRACGPVIQEGFAATNGNKSTDLCQGGNANYTLKAKVIGNGVPAYQWQQNFHGAGWTDIPGKNADALDVSFTNADTGVYRYRLGVANGSAITEVACRVYSPPLTVFVNPVPVVPPIAPTTVCEGYTLKLTASGGASYTWSGPNLPPTKVNPLIINNATPANAGTYTVQALSDSGCVSAPVQVTVKVVPKVVAAISNNVTICAGQSTQLTASGGLYYRWTPSAGLDQANIPNPVATPAQTITYTVDVSNGGCDDSTRTVTVTVNKNPVANAGFSIKLFEGQTTSLKGAASGDNITDIFWTPSTALSDPRSLTPTASPTDDITYTLNVVSQTCGTATSTVFVRVYKKITIPNTFTPNNDGTNDYWNIEALVTYPESNITVFNRYGQPVYQGTGYAVPWDGKYKGEPVPTGTYYYIIDLKNNAPRLTGWVLIVR